MLPQSSVVDRVRIALAIASLACASVGRSDAKCFVGASEADRLYGPVDVFSPRVADSPDERARVEETRNEIRRLLIRLRDPHAARKAGYGPPSRTVATGNVYVLRSTQDSGANGIAHGFDLLRPAALIYRNSPSNRGPLPIGAYYTFSEFNDFGELDLAIPLNLARWKQTRPRCTSPAALIELPWSVDVFP